MVDILVCIQLDYFCLRLSQNIVVWVCFVLFIKFKKKNFFFFIIVGNRVVCLKLIKVRDRVKVLMNRRMEKKKIFVMQWILYLVFFMQLLYIVYVLLEREVQLMVMLVRFVYVQLMMLGVVEGRMVEILVDVVSVVDVVIFVMLQLCGMYVQLGNGVLGLKLIGLF